MKKKKITILITAFTSCLLLANCTRNIPPGDYDATEVGKIKKVIPGTIISMRPVRLHNKHDNALTPQPAVVEAAEVHRSRGYEYVIRLNSGSIISVVQAENIKLKNKQPILVIYGKNTRVVPDNGSEDY